MRLSRQTERFALCGVPMVGNLATGGVIGLTSEGDALCRAMAERDVPEDEVPEGCLELVEHLGRGGYLEGATPPGVPAVASAYLHVTQRCNLACRFCYSNDAGRNALPDPSASDLGTAVRLLASLGARRLVLSGGEPFLRDDLGPIASHARGEGFAEVIVLTNGTLVTREAIRSLGGSVDVVGVAFDGAAPDDEPFLRGAQRHARLVEAVAAIRDEGVEARILPTLHSGNVRSVERYRELAESLGASLSFSLLTAPADELGGLALPDRELERMGRDSFERGVACGDDVVGGGRVTLCVRTSCGAGTRTLSVAADGTVYPCHMLHRPELAMGNAFSDPAEAILSSETARSFRALDVREIEGCASCPVRLLCGGGCRARALMSSDLRSRDPYCSLSRTYYDCMGKRLAERYAGRR